MAPAQDEAQTQAEHAARSPIQSDLRTGGGQFGGTVHGNKSTTVQAVIKESW